MTPWLDDAVQRLLLRMGDSPSRFYRIIWKIGGDMLVDWCQQIQSHPYQFGVAALCSAVVVSLIVAIAGGRTR